MSNVFIQEKKQDSDVSKSVSPASASDVASSTAHVCTSWTKRTKVRCMIVVNAIVLTLGTYCFKHPLPKNAIFGSRYSRGYCNCLVIFIYMYLI